MQIFLILWNKATQKSRHIHLTGKNRTEISVVFLPNMVQKATWRIFEEKNPAKMFNLKGYAHYGRSIPWPEGWGWVCYWGGGGWSCLLSQDRPEQPGSECSLAVPPVAPERQSRTVGLAGSHPTKFLSIVKMYFLGSLKSKGIYLEVLIFTNFWGPKYTVVQCTMQAPIKKIKYYEIL